jgi:cellulose synthase/poly-beta-1,6-N-acetylglucosamine synthase-like glycosyltransferase
MMMLAWLFALVSLFLVGMSLYLVMLAAAACFFKKKVGPQAEPQKLAVVVPAHNEAGQIAATIGTIRRSSYPATAYGVIVIADNCDDATAAEARAAGAEVFERLDPVHRGKGQALDWLLRNHADAVAVYDGVVIVDADTLIDANFLMEMSASLSHPEVTVVQGFYGASNPTESWRTALMEAALCVFHHVRPAGRNRLGGSAGLKGNGMAFRTETLLKYGWPAHSVVEDLEFGALLLLDGILVHYNPDAIVRAEMAATRKQAESQRRRWEGGRLEVLGKMAPSLLRSWIAKRQFRYFDGFMDLLIPPLSALILALIGGFMVALLASSTMTPLLGFALAGSAFYVFTGLVLKHAPPAIWLYLAAAPFLILWKIPLYLGLLKGRGAKEWVRTQRKSEIERDSETSSPASKN